MDKTEARGALTPGLAALLDTVANRGRKDRMLSQLGMSHGRQGELYGQLSLFYTAHGTETFMSYKGEEL